MKPIIINFTLIVSIICCLYNVNASTNTANLDHKENWFISDLKADSIFVDLSYLNDPPAGKYGFVKSDEEKLVFENGNDIKFWGVALSAGACFPDKKNAVTLAKRLSALGFNLVRLHHMDAVWAGRGLIDYSKNDSQHFNFKNLERLDYLISALKKEGIYIYLDLLVSREFKDNDGIKNASTLPYAGKGSTIIHPRMIELQKEYANAIWNHINPYTGLRYREDPCFAFTLITNENDVTSHFFLTPNNTPDHPELGKLFQQRLNEYAIINKQNRYKTSKVWETVEGRKATNAIMTSYFKDIYVFLRKIGVKTLITGTNWAMNLHDLPALSTMDFMDQHIYGEGDVEDIDILNSPLKKVNSLQSASFARLTGKPFVVSEWNKDYPKTFRAEYPLSFAAVAAFQDWNAVILYSYSHDSWTHSYLHHPNDTVIDPARITLMPAAALIFRNGVKSANVGTVVKVNESDIYTNSYNSKKMLAFSSGLWKKRLSLSWDKNKKGITLIHNFISTNSTQIKSADSQLFWDWKNGCRVIDTPVVQAMISKGNNKLKKSTDVIFDIDNQFFAIAITSMDGLTPINRAKKLWITSAAKAKNGSQTILVEKVVGKIFIKNSSKALKYRTVNGNGETKTGGNLEKDSNGFWLLSLNINDKTNVYEVFE